MPVRWAFWMQWSLGGKSRDVVPYVVVLAILVVKPYGIFGTRTIERL